MIFLVFLAIAVFPNQVWTTSLNTDSVITTSSNFSGTVTRVIDGDTLDVTTTEDETITIRLALIDAPEKDETGFNEATNFITEQCLDKSAEVDPDNNQGLTYGRTVAVVYCTGINVNEAILDNNLADLYKNFCNVSEFADTNWAQEHGCSNNSVNESDAINNIQSSGMNNDLFDNYVGEDLDCKDFDEKNIPVGNDDPHNLDADGDGIGCEG